MRKGRKNLWFVWTMIAIVFSLIASAAKPVTVHKILIDVPLYAEASYDSERVLEKINRNEVVDLLGEETTDAAGTVWRKVRYNGMYEGFVPGGYLYESTLYDDSEIQVAKATGKSSSEAISVYSYYDGTGQVVATLTDGEKVNVVLDGRTYAGFVKIAYDDHYYYVKSENVTTGLTYNQRLAVIIGGALFVGLLIFGAVVVVLMQRKRRTVKEST